MANMHTQITGNRLRQPGRKIVLALFSLFGLVTLVLFVFMAAILASNAPANPPNAGSFASPAASPSVSFYFEKRLWLADARTLVSLAQYVVGPDPVLIYSATNVPVESDIPTNARPATPKA